MRGQVFWGVLTSYALLLVATGYLTFLRFPGMPTLPTPEMVAGLGNDTDFKADLLEDVKAARQRASDLIKLAAHSFDVTLGALLGFLSAAATGVGLTRTDQAKQQNKGSGPADDTSSQLDGGHQ